MTLYKPEQHHAQVAQFGFDMGVMSRAWADRALWLQGYPVLALAGLDEGLAMAEQLSHPFTHAWALGFAAIVHQHGRETQLAHEQAQAVISIAIEHEFPQLLGAMHVVRGWALAQQGLLEEGVDEIRAGIATWETTESKAERSYFLAVLAETLSKAGQRDEALRVLDQALDLVAETEEQWWAAEIYRLKGELLLIQEADTTEIEGHFHKAIEVARQQSARLLELRATTSLARLWQSQGRRQDAHDLLCPVYDWFTEGFDTADLKDAKALLDDLT
ncbi:MAG: hypothetical protein IIA72_18120 [Proteobacteria bacterium]|nr:hypothetical protein [Pseudomonadota bacterium]